MSPDRLRRSQDIAAVFQSGRHRAGPLAVCHVRDRDDQGPTRLTVVASRKVGTAVARNRAKRLLREAARTLEWRRGQDVVLVARASCAEANAHSVAVEVRELAGHLNALDQPLADAS
ncbi:MAG: ribonuclease P protein component [Nitriliruptorales bacterium]|nr:ribonuclease P protein component [Nitriliruptorales bacterium]